MKDLFFKYIVPVLIGITVYFLARVFEQRGEIKLAMSDKSQVSYKRLLHFASDTVTSERINGYWAQHKLPDSSFSITYILDLGTLDTITYILRPDSVFTNRLESSSSKAKLRYRGKTTITFENDSYDVHRFVEKSKLLRRSFYFNETLGVFLITSLEPGGVIFVKSFVNNYELSDIAEHLSLLTINPRTFTEP